jgi:hypothetical protein
MKTCHRASIEAGPQRRSGISVGREDVEDGEEVEADGEEVEDG